MRLKIAILEYICCSGVFSDCTREATRAPLTALLAEGYAMLSALTRDLIEAGVDVHSPLEASIAAWPRSRTWTDSRWTRSPVPYDPNRSVDDVATLWIDAIEGCDAAIVIAPELDGILPQITHRLRNHGISVLAGDELFVATACDQLRTCQAWHTANVRHPETYLLEEFLRIAPAGVEKLGWVVKRRDSAGCVGQQRFETTSRLVQEALRRSDLRNSPDRWVVQPWVLGTPVSLAALCEETSRGEEIRVLGAFEQHFAACSSEQETGWGYAGGAGPVPGVTQKALDRFADEALHAIPGKPRGWVGIDFVIEPDGSYCAIEVNPRLTTSYLGYRKWYGPRLAGSWAHGNLPPPELREFPRVCFSVEGFEG